MADVRPERRAEDAWEYAPEDMRLFTWQAIHANTVFPSPKRQYLADCLWALMEIRSRNRGQNTELDMVVGHVFTGITGVMGIEDEAFIFLPERIVPFLREAATSSAWAERINGYLETRFGQTLAFAPPTYPPHHADERSL